MTLSPALAKFVQLYSTDHVEEALKELFPMQTIAYENLECKEGILSKILLNALDALCFGNFEQAILAVNHFEEVYKEECKEKDPLSFFLKRLKMDAHLLLLLNICDRDFNTYLKTSRFQTLHPLLIKMLICEREEILLEEKELYGALRDFPAAAQAHLSFLFRYSQNWVRFRKKRKDFIKLLTDIRERSSRPKLTRTFYPLTYQPLPGDAVHASEQIHKAKLQNAVAAIFMEPLLLPWQQLLKPLESHQTLFIFRDLPAFLHCIAIDDVLSSLLIEGHEVFLLDHYPQKQIHPASTSLIPISLSPSLHSYHERILSLIKGGTQESFRIDLLYQLGKNLCFAEDARRLGIHRSMALREFRRDQDLQDYHKSDLPLEIDLGPSRDLPFHRLLTELPKRRPGKLLEQKPIKICHVVPQIVDGNHAPSRILRTLLDHHDRSKFDPSVIVTERLLFRPLEYPYNLVNHSISSKIRGKQDIACFQKRNIPVEVDAGKGSFLDSAKWVAEMLKQKQVSAAIFHGPDPINTFASLLSACPCHLLVEHGVAPSGGGYDLVISSTVEDAGARIHEGWKSIGIPFSVDVCAQWDAAAYPREFFGTPPGAIHMTTISNHLETRLSEEMLQAIAWILKRNPLAYYLPIGPLNHAETLFRDFEKYGVARQFWPMGRVPFPSQYARSMDLYLNEFPLGGCLGLLDAMAAGCPIVTMYYPNGPSAWKYGGSYCGIERAVASGDWRDYAERAEQLVRDPLLRKEWSAASIAKYRNHADPLRYVKALEEAIQNLIRRN